MKLDEFVDVKDASNYDPNEDKINAIDLDDTRKPVLSLKDLNRLKKMRALKSLDALKRQDILAAIYAKAKAQDTGGMGGF